MKLYKNLRSNYDKQARYRDTVTLNSWQRSKGVHGSRQDKNKEQQNYIKLRK